MTFDLYSARMNEGMTIAELSAKSGVSRQTLMRIEAGAIPHAPTAKRIADVFKRDPAELWPRDPEPKAAA